MSLRPSCIVLPRTGSIRIDGEGVLPGQSTVQVSGTRIASSSGCSSLTVITRDTELDLILHSVVEVETIGGKNVTVTLPPCPSEFSKQVIVHHAKRGRLSERDAKAETSMAAVLVVPSDGNVLYGARGAFKTYRLHREHNYVALQSVRDGWVVTS